MAQYVGVLDSPWTNVAVAIEKLWHESVKTGKGLEEVLKSFETEVSQAIMLLMENTLTLDKKVCVIYLIFRYFFDSTITFIRCVLN